MDKLSYKLKLGLIYAGMFISLALAYIVTWAWYAFCLLVVLMILMVAVAALLGLDTATVIERFLDGITLWT